MGILKRLLFAGIVIVAVGQLASCFAAPHEIGEPCTSNDPGCPSGDHQNRCAGFTDPDDPADISNLTADRRCFSSLEICHRLTACRPNN